jgi:hypothetical protein
VLELGLLEFVNSRENKLFEISNKNFSSYFRKNYKSLINDEKTFYCLRHLVIDIFKQSDCKIEHYQAFVGHSQSASITFGYSNPINIKLLKELLKYINYSN